MPARVRARRNATTFLPQTIGHAMVFVVDMKRSIAFYRDILGLEPLFESDAWTEFRTGDATLALHQSDEARPRDTGISFNVGNVDDTVGALVKRGVRIVRPPAMVTDDVRCAAFADVEGNVIGIAGR